MRRVDAIGEFAKFGRPLPMKKTTAILLLRLFALALALVLLLVVGRPAYRRFKLSRFVRQTEAAMARHDYRAAWLGAQQILRHSPTNVGAMRTLVQIAAKAGIQTEVDLRRRLVEMDPSLQNQFDLIGAALRHQRRPYPVAAEVLETIAPVASNNPAFHMLSAELALKLGQLEDAATHFKTASGLDPTNAQHQLNLAVLRLGSTNAPVAEKARAELESLAADPGQGALALNWLVSDALRRHDTNTAAAFSSRLLKHPKVTLKDQLLHLELLAGRPGKDFQDYLARLQSQSATNPPQAFQLSAWLVTNGRAETALDWLRSLPAGIRTQQPVPLALGDCLLAIGDWDAAERYLRVQSWGEFEYLRLAFRSEVARQRQQFVPADNYWREAVREAGERLGALTDLAALARDWRLNKERSDLLWFITEKFPRQRWTLRELDEFYLETKNVRGLSRVYQAQLAYQPKDVILRNNLASVRLLLDQHVPEAVEVARELYERFPDNPVIASTQAFALYKQGRAADGIAVLAKLRPEFQKSPSVAAYYAVLLAATGETNHAREFAAAARTGDLFPEELALLSDVDGRGTNRPTAKQP